MKGRVIAIEIEATSDHTGKLLTPENTPEEIFTFSRSTDFDPEWLLADILNDDEAIINDCWCNIVRELIRKQPLSHSRHDRVDISHRLVDIIQTHNRSQQTRKRPQFQRESHVIFDQASATTDIPASPIPFEVGLQLLQGERANATADAVVQKFVVQESIRRFLRSTVSNLTCVLTFS
jgi:hypothetical protein